MWNAPPYYAKQQKKIVASVALYDIVQYLCTKGDSVVHTSYNIVTIAQAHPIRLYFSFDFSKISYDHLQPTHTQHISFVRSFDRSQSEKKEKPTHIFDSRVRGRLRNRMKATIKQQNREQSRK